MDEMVDEELEAIFIAAGEEAIAAHVAIRKETVNAQSRATYAERVANIPGHREHLNATASRTKRDRYKSDPEYRDRIRAQHADWVRRNSDSVAAKQAEYRLANRDHKRQSDKIAYAINVELREKRKLASRANWAKSYADPDFRSAYLAKRRERNSATKIQTEGETK